MLTNRLGGASAGHLTDRERDILAAVARGLSNAEFSQSLFIGAATVKSHVSNILLKTAGPALD